MAAFPILAHSQLAPKKVFLFNDNPELCAGSPNSVAVAAGCPIAPITVASLTVKVGDGEEEEGSKHRLVIDYSSVGAITPAGQLSTNPKATLFLGCFVDGSPCVGTQTDPATVPAGWVNVLSCNFTADITTCAQWDNGVDHVWYTGFLSPGTHTVVIKATVGNALVPSNTNIGNPGILFDEARNLVVTVLGSSGD
jgi:hypothetical protein